MAVQQLIDAVKPADLSGTLILVPLVNVPSFEKLTPHVNPTDNKSMNSRYPGDPAGTQTDRASAVITKEVIEQCDHLIDLHGGDLDENLRPYSYWTVTGNQKQDQESRAMLLAFGLDHIIISDRPKDPKASRFLENTATTRGKASFTAEAGRSGPVAAGDVAALVNGSIGTMKHLKMLAGAATPVGQTGLGREDRLGAGRARRRVSRVGRPRRARREGREDRVRHRLPEPSAAGRHGAGGRHRHVHSRRAVAEER